MDLSACQAAGLAARMQLLTQLLDCLAHMLRQPYPCPVPLPGQAVLALASSILTIQPAGMAGCLVQAWTHMEDGSEMGDSKQQLPACVALGVMHHDGAQLVCGCLHGL